MWMLWCLEVVGCRLIVVVMVAFDVAAENWLRFACELLRGAYTCWIHSQRFWWIIQNGLSIFGNFHNGSPYDDLIENWKWFSLFGKVSGLPHIFTIYVLNADGVSPNGGGLSEYSSKKFDFFREEHYMKMRCKTERVLCAAGALVRFHY